MEIIDRILNKVIKKDNKLTKYIKGIISVSISVQIVIMPIMIYNYKTISLTFLVGNILTSFLITLIIIFGFLIIILSPLFKIIKIFGIIYKILIQIFLQIIKFTSKIPFSKIYVKTPFFYQIIIYYILVFLSGYLIKKNKIKKYKKQIIAIILIMILVQNLIDIIPKNKLEIYFIDVGQGDSSLIVTPGNKTILIDGGGSENYDVRKEYTTTIFAK